jgi:general secretion pathway protein G
MAVLVILGLLFALVGKNVLSSTDKARQIQTKANLKELHSTVKQFKMETGRYPTEEQGLMELIEQPSDVTNWPEGGYLDQTEVPTDAWGNEFIYERYPESGKPFHIKSLGADGAEGGEGYDMDILSTDSM